MEKAQVPAAQDMSLEWYKFNLALNRAVDSIGKKNIL